MDKSDLRSRKERGAEIPSYVLYGEAYGGPFPDCLHCETIAARSSLHDWHIRPHRHYGLHQFLWIEQGAVIATNDSARHVLAAPVAVMNPPTAVHSFEFEPGTEGYVVTVPTVNLERSLPQPNTLLSRLDHPIILQCARIDADPMGPPTLFGSIAREYRDLQEGRAEALLCQAGLLALWFLRESGRRAEDDRPEERPHIALVRRFLALLEDHFREHRPLSFYGRELKVTIRHLTRLCRRQLGVSAQAVIHDRLTLEAKRLLAYTPASVTEIAEELGFRDPAYFSRFFTAQVGETPTSFRKAFVH